MLFLSRIRRFFYDRQRNIFRYYDGSRWRRADPLVVGMKLEELCPEYLDLLELIGKDPLTAPVGPVRTDLITQQKEAAKKIAEVSRTVFNVTPLSDTDGLTGPEAIGVLTNYFLFMEKIAEGANLFHNSPVTV